MAFYKYSKFLKQNDSAAYDSVHKPGVATPHSGVYRCVSCGVEIVSEKGKSMPPTHANIARNHEITWQLVVFPNEKP
jgi:hypothetical protein